MTASVRSDDALLRPWVDVLGTAPAAAQAGRGLLARYAEPHRRYHDLRHLGEVLDALTWLTGPGAPPGAVVLAAYFHDAVYEPAASDNEERSARLAGVVLRGLGRPDAEVDEVVRLVRATRTHEPAPGDEAAALLCDADLSVLGAPRARYRSYAADVRAEYGHLDDAAFRRGRVTVLRALAERPRLFTTPQAHRRWDTPARRNLEDELALLGADRLP